MSSGKFITNKQTILSEVIQKIMPTTSQIDMLVGFFYFSGFDKLSQSLQDKELRILVGMEIEINLKNKVQEVYKLETENKGNIKENYIKRLKKVFNNSDVFDNQKTVKAMDIFIKKIIDGSLEIKKTIDPNHSKLYLFYESENSNQGGDRPGVLITGSSNFTYSWLQGRQELNVRFDDKQTFAEGQEVFEELWGDAIPITNGGKEDLLVKVLQNETWLKKYSPYEAYIKVLDEYFKIEENVKSPYELTNKNFKNLKYQIDAIKKGLKILEEHNGLLVADVVGLGKSIIGSTLLANINKKAIIICPPHLKDQWKDYAENFSLKQIKVFPSGSIEKALKYDQEAFHKAKVILVDETHKYRNADTNDYGFLHQLCQGKKVILLSATPFNNEPNDIFNLIKLFQIPLYPTIHTKKGLISDFSNLQNKYTKIRTEQQNEIIDEEKANKKFKKVGEEIRELISPVVIRRSRIDLENIKKYKEDLEKEKITFSQVEEPEDLLFELGEIKELYIKTAELLLDKDKEDNFVNFTGARYKALSYLKKEKINNYKIDLERNLGYRYSLLEWRQKNMPLFILRLLISRFESSIFAFKKTLQNIIKNHENTLNYLEVLNGIPVIKKGTAIDFEDWIGDKKELTDDKLAEIKNKIKEKNGFLIEKKDLKNSFFSDLKRDLNFLKDLQAKWWKIEIDPKLDSFVEKIKKLEKKDPQRKIVVFSMFADTANYLQEKLGERSLLVTGKQKTEKLKEEIKLNFDAGISKNKQKNDYDILVGTDAISEGYNLHRAGIVINYDIPYNPTRVIQRIGRINRINKKVFDKLYIYNYFPSLEGEEHIGIKRIASLKIKMITTVLGMDTKTLSGEEKLESFYKKELEKDSLMNDGQSWDVAYKNDYDEALADKKLMAKIKKMPPKIRMWRIEKKEKNGLLLFAKKGENLIFYFLDKIDNKITLLSTKEAFALFKTDEQEKSVKISTSFYENYEKIKEEIIKKKGKPKLNIQENKSFERAKDLNKNTNDDYYQLLMEVIELRALPKIYMKMVRNISKDNWQKEVVNFRKEVSKKYLQKIIKFKDDFEEKALDLIISEEF